MKELRISAAAYTPGQGDPVPEVAWGNFRARLEEAAQSALDVADKIIAALDHIDGDADFEPDADAEPSLASPKGHDRQVEWARGGDQDREAQAPEAALPVVEVPEAVLSNTDVIPLSSSRWGGAGNILSATGIALLELLGA